jgi:hypothetical protein
MNGSGGSTISTSISTGGSGGWPGRAIAWGVAAAVGLLVVGLVYVPHVRAYFFLFDDYSLVGVSSRASPRDIVTQPLFGFYRPAAFLLTRAEFQAFGGWNPAGFAASALVLHALNACVAGLLAHRLRVSTVFTLSTAALFLLSPWAGEAFFWSSARFDLLATLGVFLALLLGDLAADANRSRASRVVSFCGAALASLLALCAKEAAVMLPLLFLCYEAMRARTLRREALIAPAVMAGIFAIAVGAYLWGRQAVLPGLAGAYGNFGTLIAQGNLPRHFLEYASALVLVPVPMDWSWTSLALSCAGKWPFLTVSLPALLLLGVRGAWRQMAWCVAAFAIALAPVSWIGMTPMNTASGRLLYMPGLFFALMLARGLHEIFVTNRDVADEGADGDAGGAVAWRPMAAAVIGALVVPLLYFTGSLVHQQRMWQASSGLARLAVRQFEPLVGTQQPVFLQNLPFWFEEGPFVLKGYAFGQYYAPRPVPPVRAMASVLAFGADGTRTVREVARIEEPGALPSAPIAGERVFSFTLPVQPAPASAAAER